ncbi:MAG TPA: glutamate synthase large subunit, partial [Lachnospiraceae bacterium]|nr:glutamate synthase large subunit [Lachnospiraceae bacterium]
QDLQSADYESAIATVHSRFSTNTNPSWQRAHPNRFIVHNGEINTIRGNADKMLAREETMESKYLKGQMHKVTPVINAEGSDSAMLDNALEFLVMSGMELPLAVMITIPEPWSNDKSISKAKQDFYQYYATMMEPWDGPASILFSDGDIMGAVLDRNGLRPSRYYITSDDNLILSSEVGVLDIPADKIVRKERLRPGKMLLVDTVKGILVDDDDLKNQYAKRQPYGEWLDGNLIALKDLKIPNKKVVEYSKEERARLLKAFGYTYEEYKTTILPMAQTGGEPIAAMGADSPLSVLSDKEQPLFSYFKQLFAQVTNPPIDAIREEIVTATTVYIGKDGNLLEEKAENCNVLKINNPILTNTDLLKIKNMKAAGFKVEVLPITYYKNTSLERAIEHLFIEADRAYKDGANVLILTDRGVDENHVAIPSLLAVSALQQHLVKTKKRTRLAMILESAEPREVHHFATLLGYGACAINPYLAQECIKELIENNMLDKDYYAAVDDYNKSIMKGIVKIGSKMGISTIQSYQGSKIFEAIGISKAVVDKYFTDTVSRIGGISIKDIEKQVDRLHSKAFDPLGLNVDLTLDSVGSHKLRSNQEEHLYNPKTIHLLQSSTRTGNYDLFKEYTQCIDEEGSGLNLRGLLDFNFPEQGIDLKDVESVDSIVKRFKTGAMSYGSISKEAHETLAIAMNRLGGKSNSGEGGESLDRLQPSEDGNNRCSAIKQVASGRFGVTSQYLVSAEEIQIKMAQGAKPGEGGHLPGKKVYPWVAKTRHSTPGVGLISPPPHHDIYSIEDLAQLIYDLKNSNTKARISVKLVSEAGVGTIAAGVAKAGAGVILISGYDGGTGAAPRSSIYNAGLPWELGLAETHQTLIRNGLRNKVRIETDGKLMSGRDVLVAALLGAEEFGFATAPLVTMGCVMMRVCDKDTCPVGVATQNPELRKNFKGKPEYVENFMRFIAQELREYMAKLGAKTIDELVGRTDLLKVKSEFKKDQAKNIDMSAILCNDYLDCREAHTFDPKQIYDFELEKTIDEKIFLKKLRQSIVNRQKKTIDVDVTNIDRSLGTILGSEITRIHGTSLEEDTITIKCHGAGGQSFGAFIPRGLTLELIGDSNDYLGKGLSGGKIIVYPPKEATYKAEENIIIGNVALYGATSGKVFINGIAGERFCVRNSGATTVVEGVGDHGCEYMTGGRVVVLGSTGKNFAAGMSGGIAYVLDEKSDLYMKMNKELVAVESVIEKYDVLELKNMIEEHVKYTNSARGKEILDNFETYLPKFKKIIPHDYRRMLLTTVQMEEKGLNSEQAQIEAFYANTRK